MARLKEKYKKEIVPQLVQRFSYSSSMQAPKVEKIVLNMGLGEAKQNSNLLDAANEQLATIAGQQPSVRRARKSVAAFKVREGMPVGIAVTLRKERMYEMLDRLVSIAIPRIRDFRGLNPRSFDGQGNYSLGIREQIVFPEIDYDAIDEVRGLDITITTTASSDEEGFELLKALGMPFRGDTLPGQQSEAEVEEEEKRKQEARARAEAEQAALEELKLENPEAYEKPQPKASEEEEEGSQQQPKDQPKKEKEQGEEQSADGN